MLIREKARSRTGGCYDTKKYSRSVMVRGTHPMKWRQVGLFGYTLLVSILAAALLVAVVILTVAPELRARDIRIIGLGFNALGALVALLPRVVRERGEIEKQAMATWDIPNPAFVKAQRGDTVSANAGMVLLLVGFFLQLIGNVFS